MRIDSSGNVGIGTSSPNNYSANHKSITLNAPTTPLIDLEVNGTRTGSFVADSTKVDLNAVTSVPIRFLTADTERMRIDSSGNLLVNSTSIYVTSSGSHFGAYGSSASSSFVAQSDGAVTGYINRNTSDGELLRFSKSGTTVGSIGTENSHLTIGKGDTGIKFQANEMIIPWNLDANTLRDDAISLGNSTNRFKDLYLSGGVYLGGTGAANKLTDYESGSWTPTFASTGTDPTVTYGTRHASYRKVGSLVTVWIDMTVSSYTGGTGNGIVESFPFSQSGSARGVISGRSTSGITYDKGFQMELIGGIGYFSEDALGDLPLSDFSTGGFRIIMSGSYTTA
jgi:hypothetical protein